MIHRDIKPENIVVTPGGEVVFIDFGTMRSYKKDGSRDTFVVGTRGTAATRAVWLYTEQTSVQMCMQSGRQCCIWFQRAMKRISFLSVQ